MIKQAHAKINLGLNVVSKRDDGYHELEMIMVPLEFHDTIEIEISDVDSLSSNDPSMPCNDNNTIMRAIKVMRGTYSLKHAYRVYVDKKIPMQAGLAGGSSDAAAVIQAINDIEGLNRPLDELVALGKKVGADVCFCIQNTCAIVKGIGDKIQPFMNHCDFSVLLVKPHIGISTREAYETLDFTTCIHPNCEDIKDALMNDDFNLLCTTLGNTLEKSAFKIAPEVSQLKQQLIDIGFEGVLMSGSGSTVFALTRNNILLKEAQASLKKQYPFVEITKINNSESKPY
ncbi:MAG: 4-(cytidine 5'-diphospho)-2-C-methyl-D-erythritol kinase [Erysipelotrichaceae bacterium]